MTYLVISMTYAEANKRTGNVGVIRYRNCKNLNDARKKAYKIVNTERGIAKCEIFDEDSAEYFKGLRVKSTIGEQVGEVIKHWVYPNTAGSQVFYYPDFDYSPNKNMKYRKYFLRVDGSLGQGHY